MKNFTKFDNSCTGFSLESLLFDRDEALLDFLFQLLKIVAEADFSKIIRAQTVTLDGQDRDLVAFCHNKAINPHSFSK